MQLCTSVGLGLGITYTVFLVVYVDCPLCLMMQGVFALFTF